MNYHTHKIGGMCFGLAAGTLLAPKPLTVESMVIITTVTITSMMGSMLPDIDEPKSKAGSKARLLSGIIKFTCGHRGIMHSLFPVCLFAMLLAFVNNGLLDIYVNKITWSIYGLMMCYLVFNVLMFFLRSRKNGLLKIIALTLACVILICCKLFVNIPDNELLCWIISGFIVGYVSHLFLDMLTRLGVPLFWPITNNKINVLRLQTGKDEWVGQLISIVFMVVAISINQHHFINFFEEVAAQIKSLS